MPRLLLLLLVAAPGLLGAQETPRPLAEIPRSARVRVLAPSVSPKPLRATLLGTTADSLYLLRSSGRTTTLSWNAVDALELGRADHLSGALHGLGIGAVSGAVILGLISFASFEEGGGNLFCGHRDGCARVGAISGAMIGAPVGLVIGALRGRVRWRPVTLSR
jgi:hypothetical protein